MTSRWLICFNALRRASLWLLALWCGFGGGSLVGATVSGSVTLVDSKSSAVAKQHDYSGVVISLTPVPAIAFAPPARHAVMLQKNKTFLPHVLPVLAGTFIDFPNGDPIFHNAFSNYSGQIFDVGLYPPGKSRSVRFTRPGAVRVFCNIHATMSALILVLNTPYFALTGKNGSWTVDVPPGEYELEVFHERAKEDTLEALTRRIAANGANETVPPIAVSETGFLPASHQNKFGKPYTEPADDRNYYPGARK